MFYDKHTFWVFTFRIVMLANKHIFNLNFFMGLEKELELFDLRRKKRRRINKD